jgi:hypothetical protein
MFSWYFKVTFTFCHVLKKGLLKMDKKIVKKDLIIMDGGNI